MGETWRDDLAYLQDCVLGWQCCLCAAEVYLPDTLEDTGTFEDYCCVAKYCAFSKRCSDANSCRLHAKIQVEFSDERMRELKRLRADGLLYR